MRTLLLLLLTIPAFGQMKSLPARVNPLTVIGPSSATDNAICRFDGTTGQLVQNTSGFTVTDNAIMTMAPTSTTGVTTFINLSNEADTIPRISWVANGTGMILAVGTTTVLQIQDNGEISMATGPITLASRFSAGDLGTVITSGADDRVPLRIKQNSATQTGNLSEWTTSASAVVSSVSGKGVYIPKKETADPCADTTGYAEGSIWFNDTANEHCTCVAGVDVRIKDYTTACFP